MLRSNCKKVKEALRKYVVDHYSCDGYDEDTPEAQAKTFEDMAKIILSDVRRIYENDVKRRARYCWQDAFVDWCEIMPGLFEADYVYRANAVDVLGDILEETEEERHKYSETEAEHMMSRLLYREISAVAMEVLR